jgi:hypothetical protein
MNNLNKDVIKLICNFLQNFSTEDLDSMRQCSKYLSIVAGTILFGHKQININNVNKRNRWKLRSLVHKYKISLNVRNVKNLY